MIKEINRNVQGNFSDIRTKNEYKFLDKKYRNGIMEYECKMRKAKNKRFTIDVTLCGSSFIIKDDKSVHFKGRFIGNVKEVEGGFIPCNSVTNYHSNKVYNTFDDAKQQLINKRYNNIKKRCFSLLAQKKFYYTENYLEGLSVYQMAHIIEQFTNDMRLSIKIVKKFLRSDVIDYYGQVGYKTRTQIVW